MLAILTINKGWLDSRSGRPEPLHEPFPLVKERSWGGRIFMVMERICKRFKVVYCSEGTNQMAHLIHDACILTEGPIYLEDQTLASGVKQGVISGVSSADGEPKGRV